LVVRKSVFLPDDDDDDGDGEDEDEDDDDEEEEDDCCGDAIAGIVARRRAVGNARRSIPRLFSAMLRESYGRDNSRYVPCLYVLRAPCPTNSFCPPHPSPSPRHRLAIASPSPPDPPAHPLKPEKLR
jgi:hypothetical protein